MDFDNNIVYVNVTKNRKPLIIPLNEDIVKVLQEYLKYRGGISDDWLFCSTYGEQLTRSSSYHAIWDYCHLRGLDKTGVHRFRHTFAKKWVIMGGSVVTLQKILGHSTLKMTKHYCAIYDADIAKDYDRFSPLAQMNQPKEKIKKRR